MQSSGYVQWKGKVGKVLPKREVRKFHPYDDVSTRPTRRQIALGAKSSGVDRPNYTPKREKGGKLIWNGSRSGLSFTDTVKEEMEYLRVNCESCGGGAEAIDHVKPFSERQTMLTRYLVCDGRYHFEAVLKKDALKAYNEGPFVWLCKGCNSSKGGMKGLDGNQPTFIEACPGDGECKVPSGGEKRY